MATRNINSREEGGKKITSPHSSSSSSSRRPCTLSLGGRSGPGEAGRGRDRARPGEARRGRARVVKIGRTGRTIHYTRNFRTKTHTAYSIYVCWPVLGLIGFEMMRVGTLQDPEALICELQYTACESLLCTVHHLGLGGLGPRCNGSGAGPSLQCRAGAGLGGGGGGRCRRHHLVCRPTVTFFPSRWYPMNG